MNYATLFWCKQAILLIVTAYLYISHAYPSFAISRNSDWINSEQDYSKDNYRQGNNWLGQNISECKQINNIYQEVYSFETEDSYINVCQVGDNFYYHRQSKNNPEDEILVPAEAVFGGNVFQANRGKTIYFVGKDGDRYYSSVMQNSNEIVFEPEMLEPSSIFPKSVPDSRVNFFVDRVISTNAYPQAPSFYGGIRLTQLEGINYVSWQFNPIQQEQDMAQNSSICTKSQTTLDPNLDSWVTLLGKSPDAANSIAVDNGHNFVYNRNSPHEAWIETKEGTIINLNIATTSETIERVCIEPLADNF